MKTVLGTFIGMLAVAASAFATEFHVGLNGNDTNPGTQAAPFRSIQRAAEAAQAGDVITVHEGLYRERITPQRGGESDGRRITYQAAQGAKVEIRGSEPVKGWEKVQDDTWKLTLPNSFFGEFNPYADLIAGDWFDNKNREHHTGMVYLNGQWLTEAAKLDDVLKPAGADALWFGKVEGQSTMLWAQFKGVNPNDQLVEINARKTVFYPAEPGINYITVRGFTMRHAATNWAPPTAEQVGLIGTHWSTGWIIENNIISHSRCSGIALGKYGDEWDNKSSNSAEGYVKTIERALANGWSKGKVGSHIVRNNTISHCEQTGIVGSMGAAFSTVTGNTIHDIHVKRLFGGAEMAGIKFHGAIDVEVSRNHIYRTCLSLWLDWMAQGARISRNLFHDNDADLFVEVHHGPFVVDNNVFLSPLALINVSHGGAYVHNLVAGVMHFNPHDERQTPFHKAHSTEVAALHDNPSGDDRYYNNLFIQRFDLGQYDKARQPSWFDGNVFLKDAKPFSKEQNPVVQAESPEVKLVEKPDGFYLELTFDQAWMDGRKRKLVTTELLGKAAVPNVPFERADGTPIRIDFDYLGKPRDESNPTVGPFENPGTGRVTVKVW